MEGSLPDFRDLKTSASAIIADTAPVSTPPPEAAGCLAAARRKPCGALCASYAMMRKEAAGELPSQPAPVQWGGGALVSGVAHRLFYQCLGDILSSGR